MADTRIWDGASSSVFATAGNWSDDTAPVAGDTAILPDGNIVVVDGAALYDEALAVFTVKPGYTGTIGSRTAGVISNLMLKPVIANLAGSGIAYLNLASTTTCNVTAAAAGTPTAGSYGLALSGATTTTLNIDLATNQSVGVAALAGQTGTFTTINISGSGTVVIGAGTTCSTLNIRDNPTVYVRTSIANVNVIEGSPTVHLEDATAIIATLLVQAGTVYENSTGTKAQVTIFSPASVICGQGARTWTSSTVYGTGTLDDSVQSLGDVSINNYGSGANIRLGSNCTISRGTIV